MAARLRTPAKSAMAIEPHEEGRTVDAPQQPHEPAQSINVMPAHTQARSNVDGVTCGQVQAIEALPPAQTPQSSNSPLPSHTPAQSKTELPPHTPPQSITEMPSHTPAQSKITDPHSEHSSGVAPPPHTPAHSSTAI